MMANRMIPLEIRGFSRGNSELLRPLPEKPEEPLPMSYVETVKEAFSNFYVPEDDDSNCSTPTQSHRTDMTGDSTLTESLHSESSHTWSSSTGTMTGRSSVYSWGNDNEFDRKASASVQRMFQEIDDMLYEGNYFDGGEPLLSECEEWCNRYPHLRIRGVQLLPSQETGTEFVALSNDDHRPQTAIVDMESEDLSYMLDFQGLEIQGNRVEELHESDQIREIEEEGEMFAEDGSIEEYLAYDSSSSSEDMKKKDTKNRYHTGYPPVTPNALATDTILSQVFDQIWGEIILWLRSLISLYSQNVLRGGLSHKEPFIPDLMKTSESIDSQPIPREMFARSYQVRLKSGIQTSDVDRLNELITIRSLPLKQRSSIIESRDGTPVSQTRPGSSHFVIARPSLSKAISWRSSDHHLPSRMSSAKTIKRNPSLRLQPIDRSKTPAFQEIDMIGEGVRGTKLMPGNDKLPSPSTSPVSPGPQPWGARNGTLPPIDKTEFLENTNRPRGSERTKVQFNLRASSAATDDSRKSLKERGSSFIDSRPNTTHSFRQGEISMATNRRFSTPMGTLTGQASQQLRPAGSFGYSGQGMVTGITGVSMPISNYHPSMEHGVHAHQQLYYHVEESALEEDDEIDNTQPWGHYQPNTAPSRKGRHNSSIR